MKKLRPKPRPPQRKKPRTPRVPTKAEQREERLRSEAYGNARRAALTPEELAEWERLNAELAGVEWLDNLDQPKPAAALRLEELDELSLARLTLGDVEREFQRLMELAASTA